jgi:hypothetical protein
MAQVQTLALQAFASTSNPNPVAMRLRKQISLKSAAIANAVNAFGEKIPEPDFSETVPLDHLENFLSYVGRRLKRRAALEVQLSTIDRWRKVPDQRDRANELLADLLSTPRASEVRACLWSLWAFKVKR